MESPEKGKIELPYGPTIPGYTSKENEISMVKGLCTLVFISVPVTIAKRWH